MKKKLVVAGVTTMLGLTSGIGVARADSHPPATGVPGEPNCHGQRVSHGSSAEAAGGFGITPKDRAGFNDISVQDYHQRVRRSCTP